jgi:RES domain-containing protein
MLVRAEESEVVAHAEFAAFEVHIPEDLIHTPRSLPDGWSDVPPPISTREIGAKFIRERTAAAMRVPSAVIPIESNFLLNPLHPDFGRIKWKDPIAFRIDARLTHGKS